MKSIDKPECNFIGEDGNIFNLLSIASETLKNNGFKNEQKEMQERVFKSNSYKQALNIIGEYVRIQ